MSQFKYIIIDNDGMELPVLFSKFINHDTMYNLIKGKGKLVSAGFIRFVTNEDNKDKVEFDCFGESVSLKIKSRGQIDSDIIQKDYEFSI